MPRTNEWSRATYDLARRLGTPIAFVMTISVGAPSPRDPIRMLATPQLAMCHWVPLLWKLADLVAEGPTDPIQATLASLLKAGPLHASLSAPLQRAVALPVLHVENSREDRRSAPRPPRALYVRRLNIIPVIWL